MRATFLFVVFVACVSVAYGVFCFKKKTAYEMRISDWSSDVCSSDLTAQHGSGCRLAHPDGAGEADDDHARPQPAASTKARRSSVTCGSGPNQAAKQGRAWCSSMPRPSMTTQPRARACDSRSVCSGL